MNLDEARIVLRPRSSSEILDLALRFMSEAAGKRYLHIGLLTLLPAWALCVGARYGLHWEWEQVWALALALVTPLQGLYTIAVGKLMFAEDVRLRDVFGQYLRRFPAYLVTLVLTRVLVGVTGLLVIGGDDGSQLHRQPPIDHPGFPRDILHYHADANKWTTAGTAPFSLVTTPATSRDGEIVIAGGESRPGVRSPEVWAATLNQ